MVQCYKNTSQAGFEPTPDTHQSRLSLPQTHHKPLGDHDALFSSMPCDYIFLTLYRGFTLFYLYQSTLFSIRACVVSRGHLTYTASNWVNICGLQRIFPPCKSLLLLFLHPCMHARLCYIMRLSRYEIFSFIERSFIAMEFLLYN